MGSLGHLYLCIGDLNSAEEITDKALALLQRKQHPIRFLLYETLAEIHLQKAQAENKNKRTTEATAFKAQAIKELEQALTIIQPLFPENSAHVIRIQEKLKNVSAN